MKSMNRARRSALVALAGGLAISLPANAFWGIGDITFDPTNYAELVATGEKIYAMYNTLQTQLDRLSKIQDTIQKASEAYDRLTNLNLHSMADGLTPGKYMNNSHGINGIGAARSELYSLKSNASSDYNYIKGQVSRLDDLERMMGLQQVAANNAKTSSTDLTERQASQVTAQSTSVIAALATAEEQRRQQQDMGAASESQRQTQMTDQSATLYKQLAGQGP